jgi:E3 ubiquitin-protein ligase CCNP1IP1
MDPSKYKEKDTQLNQEQLHKKNQELVSMYRDKCKKYTQITNLYNLLKSRALRSQMQTAASDSVSHTLNSLSGSRNGHSFPLNLNVSTQQEPQPSLPRQYAQCSPHQNGVEQLHSHQRSGSVSSKDAGRMVDSIAMPPPNRPDKVLPNRKLHVPPISGHELTITAGHAAPTPQRRTRLPGISHTATRHEQVNNESIMTFMNGHGNSGQRQPLGFFRPDKLG